LLTDDQSWEEAVGAELLVWLGRCSSVVVFAAGGSQVTPPLQPPPPPFQNILGAIFLFLVSMIFGAMAEIVRAYLLSLDGLISGDRGSGPVDPTKIDRYAQSIFKAFGMAITQIGSSGKTVIKS
jgi:hypothetical protein